MTTFENLLAILQDSDHDADVQPGFEAADRLATANGGSTASELVGSYPADDITRAAQYVRDTDDLLQDLEDELDDPGVDLDDLHEWSLFHIGTVSGWDVRIWQYADIEWLTVVLAQGPDGSQHIGRALFV